MTEAVIEQIDGLINHTRQSVNNIYNQGVMDGISLIYNMLIEHDDLTVDTIKDTCEAFLQKYSECGEELPDVPNLSDNIIVPKEASDMGLTCDDYADLMDILKDVPPVGMEDSVEEIIDVTSKDVEANIEDDQAIIG